jgi:hypothetical protein
MPLERYEEEKSEQNKQITHPPPLLHPSEGRRKKQ